MNHKAFEWAVIGAGPAGIAAVGKLLDQGISGQSILWIDPSFTVGDFGTKWLEVSSNTRVELFTRFFTACKAFDYSQAPHFAIQDLDPKETCYLKLAAEALQWITGQLKAKVHCLADKAKKLKLHNRQWEITLSNETLLAKSVIIATGAEPKSLNFPEVEEIPLITALTPSLLQKACTNQDTVAVFGASHSAIIILRNLLEQTEVKKVINFYLSPLRYAVYLEDGILYDDTGLKGKTAEWARANIDGILPTKLQRVLSTQEHLTAQLPLCNKAIYATGFEKRHIIIEGMQSLSYNDRNGIIAPGLFGFGIGFPEAKEDRYGTIEHRVGLWKFMDYLNRIMPLWLTYGA
ncbi:MAG: pyridine nucleotide-disulfide oxidoreductase [Gammaproteobacteria bacterium]|jgi:cation diffusion facilitator CzcD-associated flavoprotein CzcO|nr:pyridine nucleotide-disulfide oxidoreductase [Gammaproteobacteria bacterium]